jgi:hypothetical protein
MLRYYKIIQPKIDIRLNDHIYKMNIEQTRAFQKFQDGNNIFLTGIPGSGKSYTLKKIINWSRSSGFNIGVTATTGSAAILIGGTTIHSFLGIGLGTKTAEELAEYVRTKKKYIYNRLLKLDILFIDEISMLDSKLFDLISKFLSLIRNDKRPCGGIQLGLCGDIFQLPPINHKMFFKSDIWPSCDIEVIELQESQRHKDDLDFIKMLSQLRWGKCSPEILKILKNTKNNIFESDIQPTVLYTKNINVDELNNAKYDELIKEGARSFAYQTRYSTETARIWAQSCKIPDICNICVGAQVVLTWNVDLENGLCNGSRGIITAVGISGATVKFTNGREVLIGFQKIENEDDKKININFVPLRLAYALTINKCQGMTLDCAIVVLDHYSNPEFMYGKAYTALSRVRNLSNIQIHHVKADSFVVHPDVLSFYSNI